MRPAASAASSHRALAILNPMDPRVSSIPESTTQSAEIRRMRLAATRSRSCPPNQFPHEVPLTIGYVCVRVCGRALEYVLE